MSLSRLVQPKRGYLANILTIPPIVYPFQYNPTQLTDSKRVEWGHREPTVDTGKTLDRIKNSPEVMGRMFSKAHLKKLSSEGDRTVSFKFEIDGREKRPGEPDRRRNAGGDILADVAILRSFVYPHPGDVLDVIAAAQRARSGEGKSHDDLWFDQPPSCLLALGDMSMEGFVTELRITETLFNEKLDPMRAEVEITLIEKVDSISFVIDSVKRLGRLKFFSAYEDLGDVII